MFGLRTIFNFLALHECLLCGREGSLLCPACQQSAYRSVPVQTLGSLDQLWVGAAYEGVLQQLLHLYKFERAASVAPILAALLDKTIPPLPRGTVITYVPTATSRVRQRGYDHAKVLAKAFAQRRGLAVTPLLSRLGQTRQVGARRHIRLQQLVNAYQVREPARVKGAHILIIDDIVTTGATLTAAAEALYKAGADRLEALVVAQKQ